MRLANLFAAIKFMALSAKIEPMQPAKQRRPGKLGSGWMHRRLMRHFAEQNLERQRKSARRFKNLDEHGAYTEVGRDPLRRVGTDGGEIRRKWLAGISAQRGY